MSPLNSKPVDSETKSRLVRQVRHQVELFAAIVEATEEATVLLTHARMLAEASCHLVVLETAGVSVDGANPQELLQEARRVTRGLKAMDADLVALLRTLVELGNFGAHYVPDRVFSGETVDTARRTAGAVVQRIRQSFPGPGLTDADSSARSLPLQFDSIRLARKCLWLPSHRMHKVPEELALGFHAVPGRGLRELALRAAGYSLDPVLDVVIRNSGTRPVTVDRLGFLPLRTWSSLKGLPEANRIKKMGSYSLPLSKLVEGETQWLELEDPVDVPAGAPWRFDLQLRRFRKSLPGNELAAQLVVGAGRRTVESIPLYLGVY